MKIVLDTNVVLAALISPNGLGSLLVRALDKKRLINYTSEEGLTELALKIGLLLDEGKLSHEWDEILAHFIAMSEVVVPTRHFDLCRDKDDNKWLEIAYAAKAEFIITRDKDLLDLRGEGNAIELDDHVVGILTPTEFYRKIIRREC